MEEKYMSQAHELLTNTGVGNMANRTAERMIPLLNALVTGYSIALAKTLGSGAGAMTQILLSEVGEVLSAMIDEILGSKQVSYELENVEELLKNAFLELGIAEDVKIEKDVKDNMRIYKLHIKGSLFAPVHKILIDRGLKEFPLSPEGLLSASIVRRVLRERTGGDTKARVNVNTKLPVDGETLIIEIKEVSRL
ncbi:conserved hypothetical protein [Methanocaldococcus sp. FS406-22]|uniref:hypothetical protein n=1 Tax=Methanocaldococcus sp. (strain FS406-22) TaxID=644281 RepID=UPI0001BF3A01|nr:hypothetical protein [Methanocaldococcus sp. FS406-22]ADC69765.1 conserved hypothetical protein [Methanocaldococcus sp. FS406-22]